MSIEKSASSNSYTPDGYGNNSNNQASASDFFRVPRKRKLINDSQNTEAKSLTDELSVAYHQELQEIIADAQAFDSLDWLVTNLKETLTLKRVEAAKREILIILKEMNRKVTSTQLSEELARKLLILEHLMNPDIKVISEKILDSLNPESSAKRQKTKQLINPLKGFSGEFSESTNHIFMGAKLEQPHALSVPESPKSSGSADSDGEFSEFSDDSNDSNWSPADTDSSDDEDWTPVKGMR